MITLEEAKALRKGDVLIFDPNIRPAKPTKWRVNGKVKTWVTRPEEVLIPLKHGLYTFRYLTEAELPWFSRLTDDR